MQGCLGERFRRLQYAIICVRPQKMANEEPESARPYSYVSEKDRLVVKFQMKMTFSELHDLRR